VSRLQRSVVEPVVDLVDPVVVIDSFVAVAAVAVAVAVAVPVP